MEFIYVVIISFVLFTILYIIIYGTDVSSGLFEKWLSNSNMPQWLWMTIFLMFNHMIIILWYFLAMIIIYTTFYK